MTNLFKIAIGLGAAIGAAALAISISKKTAEDKEVEFEDMDDLDDLDEDIEDLEKLDGAEDADIEDEDEDDDFCSCENCKSWNGEECVCEDDCGECCNSKDADCKPNHDIKAAVNNIVDGVMGGIVVAADKVSELTSKLADFVSDKLDERKESSTPDFTFEWDDDDEAEEDAVSGAEKVAEDVKEAAEDAVEDVKDFAEDIADKAEDAVDGIAEDIKDIID